jgi:hypothetical protein
MLVRLKPHVTSKYVKVSYGHKNFYVTKRFAVFEAPREAFSGDFDFGDDVVVVSSPVSIRNSKKSFWTLLVSFFKRGVSWLGSLIK